MTSPVVSGAQGDGGRVPVLPDEQLARWRAVGDGQDCALIDALRAARRELGDTRARLARLTSLVEDGWEDWDALTDAEKIAICVAEVRDARADRARLAAVEALAEEWRKVTPAGLYPEASAHANAVENCGDALTDLLGEPAAALGVTDRAGDGNG